MVDGIVPSISSVQLPSDGNYHLGQNLDFTVNFSEAVTVDSTGGTPRLAVTLDNGSIVYADYLSGSGGSALVFHPEWVTNRPWFEHTWEDLTENGRHHCPYVRPEPKEARRVRMLRRYVPDVLPLVRKVEWHCSGCDSDYHGERYCLTCRTGAHSTERCAE